MLELLDAWVERGWLRRIDRALVRWLKELEPSTQSRCCWPPPFAPTNMAVAISAWI
ncbi:hypothetical protein [Gallaecimonas mangrovi]|uniref:hypothetical protein n=1 Tax=Gallaecimonas mangrovi TaxID=2291597 RepID=UPI00300FD36E